MEFLVLLLALLAVNAALLLGWGADSRECDNNWHPASARRRRSPQGVPNRLGPAEPNLAGGHPEILSC